MENVANTNATKVLAGTKRATPSVRRATSLSNMMENSAHAVAHP